MEIKGYEYLISNDHKVYEFDSEGPKGKIRKRVRFRHLFHTGSNYYNLELGDLNKKGDVDDLVISDNKDAEKVLVTVARIVVHFTNSFSNAVIYVEGSTSSRTRRYQMGLNRHWAEIEQMFEVYGCTLWNDWEPFQPGKNYTAFAAHKKYRTLLF